MKANALEMLTAMNDAQAKQLMATSLLAIAVCMKKAGLEEMEVGPDDFALLQQGETLEPIPRVGGGFVFRFVKAASPLAKHATPDVVKKAGEKINRKATKVGKRTH